MTTALAAAPSLASDHEHETIALGRAMHEHRHHLGSIQVLKNHEALPMNMPLRHIRMPLRLRRRAIMRVFHLKAVTRRLELRNTKIGDDNQFLDPSQATQFQDNMNTLM